LTNSCRSNTPSWARGSSLVFIVAFILCALILAGFPFGGGARLYAQGPGQQIYLQDAQPLSVTLAGPAIGAPTRAAQAFAANQAQPLTLVHGRFYEEDGIEGMAVGYATANGGAVALYRGNLDAFAPQSEESFLAIGQGRFPSPFLPTAQLFELPQRPDFLAAGQLTGTDDLDIVAASKGSSALYILANNGYGNFTPTPVFTLPGTVTALGTANFDPQHISTSIVVAVNRAQGPALLVYATSRNGLYLTAAYPLSAPATALAFGNLDGDTITDVAVIAGGEVSILEGRNLSSLGSVASPLVSVPLPFSSVAIALGSFIFDRDGRSQMALLASDGSLNIVACSCFNPTPWTLEEIRARRQRLRNGEPDAYVQQQGIYRPDSWKVIESFPAVASSGNSGVAPVLLRTRVTNYGADDLTVLDSAAGQLTVIAHDFHSVEDNTVPQGAFPPGVLLSRPYSLASTVAAAPMHLNVSGQSGLVMLNNGQPSPSIILPFASMTYNVDTTNDVIVANACTPPVIVGSCSLREAVLESDANAGFTNTINVPAGIYTLTIPRAATPAYDATTGTLNVNNSVNIVGAGQNTTIIQAGTASYSPGPANGVDMVMAVNEDITIISNATAIISNLTIQNGHNRGTHGNDGDGGCMEFDTGSSGGATLTLTSVTLQNCDTTQGSGGGLASFNFVVPTGAGLPTITNSIIQGNSVVDSSLPGPNDAVGGGIWVTDASRMSMSNSQVLNNLATQTAGGAGFGGGLYILSKATAGQTPQTQIHASTISGNQSAFQGGGVWDTANLLIDQGTIISGNKNGQNGAGAQNGAGLFINPAGCPTACLSATLTKVIITGNQSTGTGGGIAAGAIPAGPVTMNFSRLAGNTAATTGSNLENLGSPVTATNDWWGTNNPASTIHTTAGTTTFDPFIVLTHTASPQKIRINQSSTLTGDMSNDNHGNAVGLANLTEIIGLPITFDSPVLGTIPQAQPETLNASAQATATFNAGGTAGFGTANGAVDQAVVPVNSNLIASATESGTTATITTVGAHGYSAGEFVKISGVGVAGYNTGGQLVPILATPTATTFTYTASTSGLAASSGGTANAGIIILQPPSITKSFSPTAVAINAPSTITFSITNSNVVPIDASFTDNLPANLMVANTPNVVNPCGGSVTATAGATSISFSNTTFPIGTCNINVDVQSAVDNTYSNSVTIDSTDAGNGNTSSANLTVINPPHIVKAFGATLIPMNGTTSLTFTISNTNTTSTLNGIAFTDNLPAGLVVATPGNLNTTCSGTATAADGSSSASLSGATLAAGASCTVSLNVQGTTAGVKNNSVTVSDTVAGTGNTSNASIIVVRPPTISKAFNPTSIALNTNSTLSFTITNPNTASALSGVAFTDNLPAGVVVAATPNITGSCGAGTITATAGSGTITLSGGTLTASPAVGSTCTFSVDVTGTAAGSQSNTTGAITSTEGGTGTTSNTAVLTVVAPPSIAKAFNPTSIPLNGTTTLTLTITNPATNTVAETGVAFTDTLPTGLVVSTPNGLSNTCNGTATAVAGSTSITLTGGSIAANTSCTVVVNVTGTTAGQYTNTTGAVSSTNGGTGNTASANLTVVSPPTITKSFNPTSIALNANSTLSFTIVNPNTFSALSGVAFTDSLPAGLVVAAIPNVTGSCGSGTITATAGSGSISLSGGTLTAPPAAGSSCTFSVDVTGTTAGVKNNTVQVSSTEGGIGNASNASLTVIAPPTISKAFNPTSIALNATSTLSFTITNPNTASALSGVAFTDNLPAGVVVAAIPNVTGSCGSGTITAPAGSGSISLSGGTLTASPAVGSTCTFSVDVAGTTAGSKSNTTGAVTSIEGGTGTTSNTAVLTVVAPPVIAKAFNPTTIPLNGTTTLTFTITNPAANTVAEAGVAFTDTLPTGLVVSTPNGLSNTCNGTATAVAGSTSISLTGGSIAVNTSCTVVVNVTGTASGQYTNTTGAVTSTNGGTGNTASANLTVASPPAIAKSFNPTTIAVNGSSMLTFNISNPNTNVTLTGIAFADNLPAGLVVATPNGLTGSCGGGTITAVAGAPSVSLSTATLAASGSCTFSVNVTGATGGVKNNSVQVTSTEGGTGNTSNATITVISPPTLTKGFGAASIPLNGTTTLTFSVSNPNTTTGLTGIGFTDTLPTGLIIATPNGLTTTCSGTITATQGTNVINLTGASLAASGNCTFAVNVTGTAAGTKNNTTGTITSVEGGTGLTASASIDVVAPPAIAKAFNPTGIPLNGVSTLTVTITNPAANGVAENGVAFTDNFPANLVVATPNGLTNTCGGTATATAGSGSVTLTGGIIAVNSSCTVTANVTSGVGGVYTNTTGPVSSTNGGTGGTASATLTVAAPPTINKNFFATAVALNGTVSVGFDLNNPNASVDLTGVAFTDNLPAGLVVATPNGVSNNCGGTVTANAGSNTITFTGGTLPAANPTCSIFVNLKGTTLGVKNNATGPVSANESGPGAGSNTATVEVIAPPGVTKVFGAATIPLGGTTSLTFTFTNSAATVAFVNVTLTDTLPGGLVVANPNGVGGTCVTNNGAAVSANPGSNGISITAFNLSPASSCALIVNVTGTSAGTKNNTSGNVMATFDDGSGTFIGITGGTASASIAVLAPPAISKVFNPAVIPISTTTSLTFTIVNPAVNPVALTGVAFTDTLPAGLTVASSSATVCGGTLTTTAPTGIALAGATINANAQCQFSVTVTGVTAGIYTNVTGAVTSTNGGMGNSATANLTVSAADITISKSHVGNFFQGQIGAIYTITVSNVGTTPSAGTVTVVDTLPASLTATAMSGTGWTCTVATLTCTRSDVLANGASYPAITLTVNVAANAPASVTNTATVSGGGDVNPANNTANDVTTISTVFLTITPGINSATVKRGQAATFTFTVNAAVPSPITLSCSNLPQGAACAFNPLSPSSNGSTNETMLVSTTAPPGLAMIEPQGQPVVPSGKPVYMAMLTLPMLGLLYAGMGAGIAKNKRKKGKTLRLVILGIIMLGVMALAGCGGHARGEGGPGFSLPTPPGTYTITVTATSGNIQAQTNVTLTVTP